MQDVLLCSVTALLRSLSHSLTQLDPSLEAKVNVQKQSAILEEEYEVRSDGL